MLDESLILHYVLYIVTKIYQKLRTLSRAKNLQIIKSVNQVNKTKILFTIVWQLVWILWHWITYDHQKENLIKIERLQQKGARIVMKSKNMSSNEIIDHLGWKYMVERHQDHIINLITKCILHEGKFPISFYYFQHKCSETHHSNWQKEKLYSHKKGKFWIWQNKLVSPFRNKYSILIVHVWRY